MNIKKILKPVLSIVLALVLGAAVIAMVGENPLSVYRSMLLGAFGSKHTEGFLLETCSHYLEFTDEKLKGEQGASYTMMPPLRKQKDTDLLWDGIQTRMLYLFSEGVKKRGLSMKRFVELTSENAARFYHRYPQKGCIQPGSDADLVLITEKENTKIHVENRKSNLDYTIYEGKQLEGKIQIVIKSGQTVYKNGKLNAEKGSGKYLV